MVNQVLFYRTLFQCLDKFKFIGGLFLSFAGASLGLMIPQVIGRMVEPSFLQQFLSNPWMLFFLPLFFIFVYSLQSLSSYLLGRSGNEAMKNMQLKVHQHLLSLPLETIEKYQAGDLASRLTNDMSVVLRLVAMTLPQVLLNFFLVIGTFYFLFSIHLFLTLGSLILIACLVLVSLPINQKLEIYFLNHQKLLGNLTGKLSHKFSRMHLIKSLKGEVDEKEQFSKMTENLSFNFRKILRLISFQNTLLSSLVMCLILGIISLAAWQVQSGLMTMVALTTFVLYVMQLLEPVSELVHSLDDLAEVRGVAVRIAELQHLSREEEISTQISLNSDLSISLKNLSFSYPDKENPTLKNVTAQLPFGKQIALIGPSGSGKTTLFSLLMKFYSYEDGEIFIGNQSLKSLSAEEVGQKISYVSQTNTLFQGTLRESLCYGKNVNVSEERLQFVLEKLGLFDLVNQLPNGLDTPILDGEQGLSEGQKQRFTIARALMIPAEIYLLDEITASLDSVTERVIMKAVRELTAGKTCITIAHRLATIQESDLILVLNEEGGLEDQGSHEELFARNQLYRTSTEMLRENKLKIAS